MKSEELLSKIEAVLAQYRYVVKPLVAEVEAVWEKFPIPLYNEARALVDHLSKCFSGEGEKHLSDDEINEQISKAKHHIKRMILDCYKLLNINSKQVVENFQRKTRFLDLRTIDNDGSFASRYYELSSQVPKLVKEAKILEGVGTDKDIYEAYEKAHIKYVELTNLIEENASYFKKARVKRILSWMGWIVWSAITFIVGCLLTNNNAEVINFLINLFR